MCASICLLYCCHSTLKAGGPCPSVSNRWFPWALFSLLCWVSETMTVYHGYSRYFLSFARGYCEQHVRHITCGKLRGSCHQNQLQKNGCSNTNISTLNAIEFVALEEPGECMCPWVNPCHVLRHICILSNPHKHVPKHHVRSARRRVLVPIPRTDGAKRPTRVKWPTAKIL